MKVTVKIRANEIARMILSDGRKDYPLSELVKVVMDMYGVSKRQAERYIYFAKEEIAILRKEEVKDALDVALRDREFLLSKPSGHLNAKKQPMRAVEEICMFYKSQCTYNPLS